MFQDAHAVEYTVVTEERIHHSKYTLNMSDCPTEGPTDVGVTHSIHLFSQFLAEYVAISR